jgi:N-acetylglucosaminyldiphosphoundecaprenol N-acetyl-beta-D-mannosaminyltransferase
MNYHQSLHKIVAPKQFPTVNLGGLPISVADRPGVTQFMLEAAATRPRGQTPLYLTSANGEVLARCHADPEIAALFAMADQIVADGQPMVTASRYLCHVALPERVATTDLFHDVAAKAEQTGQSFYFLGATGKENARALEAVRAAYPRLNIAGACHGYLKGEALEAKLAEINALKPDILWLAMGIPHEQKFMRDHGAKLDQVGVVKTSGGLFNFLSGTNSRAPGWMQSIGFEWAWRMALEPKRLFWRYLTTNPRALMLMLTRSS